MLQEKLNAQVPEVVEDVEFVDDAEYDAVVEAYVNDQERDVEPWPEELMMQAEQEAHDHRVARACRVLVEDAHFLQGLFEDIDNGHVDELDDPAEDAGALRRMADALDVLAESKPRVPVDAPQPAPFLCPKVTTDETTLTTYQATTSTHELSTSKSEKAVRVQRAICVTLTEGRPGPTARAYVVDENGARVRDSLVPFYSHEAATTFPQDVRRALYAVADEACAYYVSGLNMSAVVPPLEVGALWDEAITCADAIARMFSRTHADAAQPAPFPVLN